MKNLCCKPHSHRTTRNRFLLISVFLSSAVFLFCFAGTPVHQQPVQHGSTYSYTLPVYSSGAGDTLQKGNRSFAPLLINYIVLNPGYRVNCTLTLGGALVGMSTLTSDAPNYQFDVISNALHATGNLQLQAYPPDQVSTLEGDFFVVKITRDSVRFKGTITGWYTKSVR